MTVASTRRGQLHKLSTTHHLAACVIGLLCAASVGWSQHYPSKPVRVISTQQAGQGGDPLLRIVATKLASSLGQPFVVDNRAGAAGNVAAELVARAPADGHTLLAMSISYAVIPASHKNLNYDPVRDFMPVSLMAMTPSVLVIHPSMPAQSVSALIVLAKSKPARSR